MAIDADGLERTIRKLRKFLDKAPREPDAEAVHQWRTRTRRLQVALEAIVARPRRNERRALRDLERLRKRAGKVRDMDVLTGHASTLRVPDEQECQVRLLEYLGAERYRQANKLRTALRRKRATLRRRLRVTSRRLEKLVKHWQTDGARDAMSAVLKASAGLADPPVLSARTLHAYRLDVKRLRDLMQLASGTVDAHLLDTLGEVKDAIGEWHDWVELIAIATDVLAHGPRCRLIAECKRTSQRKLDTALGLAKKLRQHALPADGKQAPPTPVLRAVSALGR